MGQAEHRRENPVGLLRECRADSSLGGSHRLSDYSHNQGGLQKSILHHRGGYANQNLCAGEDHSQGTHHQAT